MDRNQHGQETVTAPNGLMEKLEQVLQAQGQQQTWLQQQLAAQQQTYTQSVEQLRQETQAQSQTFFMDPAWLQGSQMQNFG
jgi:cell wall assembly regulator SMI1